jgi:hypothetical protein
MNAVYVPQAGSIAARALAHLQDQPDGAELASGVLADALGVQSNMINVCLDTASRHGVLARTKRDGRIFWKLGPKAPAAAPPPASADPADLDDESDTDAARIARTVPSASAAPIPGLVQQSWCPVAQDAASPSSGREPPPPPSSPAAPPVLGLNWRAPRVPVFERDASAVNTTPAAAPEPCSAAAPSEQRDDRVDTALIVSEFVRAARADRARDEQAAERAASAECFRCALWSNGMLEIRTTEGETHLLNEDDTRGLLRYVGDVLSTRARAAA